MKPKWLEPPRIGFSVKSFFELERVASLGINLVELKLEKFAENGTPLYFYENGEFTENSDVLMRILNIAHANDLQVQFHLPIEREVSLECETGINVAILDHHRIAHKRLSFLNSMFTFYGIGGVITMHPPTVSFGGKSHITETQALENARIFFEEHDKLRLREKHQTLIGIENQTDKKVLAGMIGYLPRHFKKMLGNTRTFGLTFDSGHRRLTRYFRLGTLLQWSIPIINFHFHGNDGVFSKTDFDDDQHDFVTKENIFGGEKAYENFMRYFRRNRPPVVLEICDLKNYTDDQLWWYVALLFQEVQ